MGKPEAAKVIIPSTVARLTHTGTDEGHFIACLCLRCVTSTTYLCKAHISVLLLDQPQNARKNTNTLNPLLNGIRFSSKIRYNVDPIRTKPADRVLFH